MAARAGPQRVVNEASAARETDPGEQAMKARTGSQSIEMRCARNGPEGRVAIVTCRLQALQCCFRPPHGQVHEAANEVIVNGGRFDISLDVQGRFGLAQQSVEVRCTGFEQRLTPGAPVQLADSVQADRTQIEARSPIRPHPVTQ